MTNRAILTTVKNVIQGFETDWTYKEEYDKNGIRFYPKSKMIGGKELTKLISITEVYDLLYYISTRVGDDAPYFIIYNK